MALSVVVGLNSYASIQTANDYLAASTRAADKWDALDDDVKARCLISFFRLLEKQTWAGTKTNAAVVTSVAAVVSGGTGYTLNQLLPIVGGNGAPAVVRVTGVSGGVITAVAVVDEGAYQTAPTNPASVNVGSATLTLTIGTQTAAFPRSGIPDGEGGEFDAYALPDNLVAANIEGAFELSQDPDLETSRSQDSNVQSVKAGSVGIDFFRATENQGRFPFVVEELLAPLLGVHASEGGVVTGNQECSQFDPPNFRLSRGMP